MFSSKCCSLAQASHSALVINSNVGRLFTGLANRLYSKGKGGDKCCEAPPQTEGRNVEPWPKNVAPPPMWRSGCPQDPPPPNYDPYRIKVPEIVVPPLPPSNAKPMLDCAKIKPPCSVKLVPPPPPCPPPPPKPFPWVIVWALIAFFSAFGLIYKIILWVEDRNKSAENKVVWRPRRKTKRPSDSRDLPPCVQYLIIGAGPAGWNAYKTIMENDPEAKVFFITNEDSTAYNRTPISKWMWWNNNPPDIKTLAYIDGEGSRKYMYYTNPCSYMDPVKFYRKKRGPAVSIATGWTITRVDAGEHAAYVKDFCGQDQPIYYERCLIATGSKPKTLMMLKTAPKAVRDRVCTINNIRDLEIAYRKVKEAKHVVIIGGGLLGSELAYTVGRMNKVHAQAEDRPVEPLDVVHVYKDGGVLSGLVPQYLGEWAAEKIRCQGVTLMPNAQVYDAFMSKDGRLELTLSNGQSLITDYAMLCIGAEPHTEMAAPSFLEEDAELGGFLVNTELAARLHLYVAGDAASYLSEWKTTRMRTPHLINAEEQGAIAGANMTGFWTSCNMEPHFFIRFGDDLNVEVVGEIGACMPTIGLFKECEVDKFYFKDDDGKGDGDRRCFKQGGEYEARFKHGIVFYLRDEIVVGMVFWNLMPPIEDRAAVVTEMLRAKPTHEDIDLLADLLGFGEHRCVYREQKMDEEECITIKKYRFD